MRSSLLGAFLILFFQYFYYGLGHYADRFKAISIGPLFAFGAPLFGAKPARKIGAMQLTKTVEAVAEKGDANGVLALIQRHLGGEGGEGKDCLFACHQYPR